MGLLNPLLLLLAGAAAVPLLLHLFQRHQGPRMIFPALRYLRRAEKESARRIRLRQILLMLLRIATVLLLTLAAARPFLRLGGVGHAPTAVAIVLDNSMSTAAVAGETRVLDELKARALEVLADAGPDDRFWLLRAGSPADPALAGDAEATAQRIRETEPTAAAADLTAALAHARSVLAAGADGRAAEIHLLTDLQATSFSAPAPVGGRTPPVVVWHPGTAPPANRAVAAVEVGGGLSPIAGARSTVTAAVTGTGDETVNVRLTVDDRLVAAGTAQPGAAAVLSLPARPIGVLTGRVDIDADALNVDDRRYFAARVLPPPAVVMAGAQPFVENALAVLEEAGRLRLAGTGAADVAIQPAAVGIEGAGARVTVVVLPPESPVELAAVNRRLASAGVPWRYQPPPGGEARFANGSDDPLLRALEEVRLRTVYPLVREGNEDADTVLLRLTDGTAWAVRGERRVGGAYVLLGSPLSPDASTLPTSAAMLPLFDRLTGAWATAMPPRTDMLPGEEVTLPPIANAVERPDGSRDDVAGAAVYRLGHEPGVYRVLRGDSVLLALAVNPPAAESDLARLDRRALDARLPGWTLYVTTDAGAWRRAAFRERLGREMWKTFLLAALVVLVLETIIAAAGRGRPSTAAVAARPSVQAVEAG